MTAQQSAPAPEPTATTGTAATAPATAPASAVATAEPAAAPAVSGRNTPETMRQLSVAVVALALLFGLLSFVAARSTSESTIRIRDNDGPVVVGLQTLGASLAEADAAATAAFLSGTDEDPRQRAAYEQALDRSIALVESISSLLADDDEAAHTAVARLSQSMTRYAADIEAARTAVTNELPDAQTLLLVAINRLQTDVDQNRGNIETFAAVDLGQTVDGQSGTTSVIALAAGLLLLAALGWSQWWLFRRTKRILNVPLVIASVAAIGGLVWFTSASAAAVSRTTEAQDEAFSAIQLTSQLQQQGLLTRSAATVAAITGNVDARQQARNAATNVNDSNGDVALDGSGDGLIAGVIRAADSPDERALAVEVAQRWNRYRDVAFSGGNDVTPEELVASGQVFGGFSFTVEGILAENQDQFNALLEDAADRVNLVPWGVAVLSLLVALLGFFGFQLRLAEYR